MLQDHADHVGVLHHGNHDLVGIGGSGVRERDVNHSVEERFEVIFRDGHSVGFGAVHAAVEVGGRRGAGLAGGYGVVVGVLSAPHEDVILARIDHKVQLIAVLELILGGVDALDKLTGRAVENEESDALYLVGESVGKLHVVSVLEAHCVVAFHAVAVIVDSVASTHGGGQSRSSENPGSEVEYFRFKLHAVVFVFYSFYFSLFSIGLFGEERCSVYMVSATGRLLNFRFWKNEGGTGPLCSFFCCRQSDAGLPAVAC